MGSSRDDQTQRRYEAGPTTIFPALLDIDGISAIDQLVDMELVGVYFDTPNLDLARRSIHICRVAGGDDTGWHLEFPAGEDTRSEVRLPLGRAKRKVPARLLAPVKAVVLDRPLTPVAQVTTRRLTYQLVGADAAVFAQVRDHEVHTDRTVGPAHVEDWREWEVTLVDGTKHLLDSIEQVLLAAGASPLNAPTTLNRALGDLAPSDQKKPSRKQLSCGSAAQLVLAHLAEHTEQLRKQDARLRADRPDSVHKLRIAARRLRGALKTYRPLLASDSADTVGEELRWLGQVLSKARDAQVMRERLHLLVASQPPELILGPVARRIDGDLLASFRTGRKEALEALNSQRYFRLLDALDDLVQSPPLTRESETHVEDLIPRLLQREANRLRRITRKLARADSPEQRDLALHEIRKMAKRLRYASESAIPVFPSRAKKLALSAKRIQEALGQHQDAVIARDKLRQYAVQTHDRGENAFTFGRLHALEEARATDAERTFEAALRKLPPKKLRRWIRM